MNYPKRRAAIACAYCRHRKRRCSGERPSCQLCRASGVDCRYVEAATVTERPAAASETLSRRVQQLETLVRGRDSSSAASRCQEATPSTPESASDALAPVHASPAPSQPWSHHRLRASCAASEPRRPRQSPHLDRFDEIETAPALIIPPGHHTITGSLFTLPAVRGLIGEYPLDLFRRIECARASAAPSVSLAGPSFAHSTVDLDPNTARQLISNYFATVHPHFTILEQDAFPSYFEGVTRQDHPKGPDMAVCLLVLAIGSLMASTRTADAAPYDHETGLGYFSLAYQLLTTEWATHLTPEPSLTTGLLLAAIYLRCLGRPLQAWKAISMASSNVQFEALRLRGNPSGQHYEDVVHRQCWTCFVLECDALAEFHLPRSGIEDAVEHMRFPNFHSQVAGRSEMLFLAFFSVRRLLNRIHNAVYASRSSPRLDVPSYATIQSLESVLTELIRQLASWYHSLTDTIRPDFASAPADMHDTWLRLRYWSAKHIATRPCLLYAVSVDAATDLPPFVMEYSEMCLQSCRNYLQTAVYALRERTPYNWMTVQASLATALVLTIASASAAVQHLVLDLEDLLTEAIAALQPWTSGDPSASMVKMILETLLQKQRLQIAGIV